MLMTMAFWRARNHCNTEDLFWLRDLIFTTTWHCPCWEWIIWFQICSGSSCLTCALEKKHGLLQKQWTGVHVLDLGAWGKIPEEAGEGVLERVWEIGQRRGQAVTCASGRSAMYLQMSALWWWLPSLRCFHQLLGF